MADSMDAPVRFQPAGGQTIGEACMQASSYLATSGVEESRANSERLLMHVLGGITPAALLRDWREPMPADRLEAWAAMVERKAAGEPLQYIIGEQWFYGLPFTVTPAVLIPRPETELLVEAVLGAADRLWPGARGAGGQAPASGAGADGGAAPTAVDVGTGSGAIAVTLASQRPRWRLSASDLSPDALAVARANAARHGTADRIAFVEGDLLAPFACGGTGAAAGLRIDVLVSNPPYIPADDLAGLQREVRDHEPRLALDGGADGLDPYRRMLAQLPALAAVPRIVAFELGQGQAREVASLLEAAGHWPDIRIITDYAGIERHVIAVAAS